MTRTAYHANAATLAKHFRLDADGAPRPDGDVLPPQVEGTARVVDRVLSGDSRAFLDSNRQTGGE